MTVTTEKRKISAYLELDLKDASEGLAKARSMSLSTLVAYLLTQEVRRARQDGEIPGAPDSPPTSEPG